MWEATLARHGLRPVAGAGKHPSGRDDGEPADRGNPWDCAMMHYAAYVGEFYDEHGEDYRYQRLLGGDHSALGDARATLALIQQMAERR